MISPPSENSPQKQALPAWIDEQLVEETRVVWEPFYRRALTRAEAVEILLSMGRLIDALTE